jgi:5-methylcytosine-specific restriction endonuclease McrBC regulatory subunit McrC
MVFYDNSEKKLEEPLGALASFSGKLIADMVKENPSILIFPKTLNQVQMDDAGKNVIFSLDAGQTLMKTGNILGYIGKGNDSLSIVSRFSSGSTQYEFARDYFMQYLLQRVFSINLFDFQHTKDSQSLLDLLFLFFPFFLKKALRQGVFRTYRRLACNDNRPRGNLEISSHISENFPFLNGKIAYSVRELCMDNPVTELIRHTIEYIDGKNPVVSHIDQETNDAVSLIRSLTPEYSRKSRNQVIMQNSKGSVHPYYHEYAPLVNVCLMILQDDRLSFGKFKDKAYGILFDGSWLWEEYLATILCSGKLDFLHPKNKESSSPIPVFSNTASYVRYPDFYYQDKVVVDTKYKNLDNKYIYRDDMNQLVTYLYLLKSKEGVLLYPCRGSNQKSSIGLLNGFGKDIQANIATVGFCIPDSSTSFAEFQKGMKESELKIIEEFSSLFT